MSTWQSNAIAIDGMELRVSADKGGVTLSRNVDGVYASDLVLTTELARDIARLLVEGADRADEAARGNA